VRKPRGAHRDMVPVLIGLPDRPVAKRRPTQRLAELLPNNGFHYHFLYCLPAKSDRLGGRFGSLVKNLRQQLCGNDIVDLDVRRYKPPAPGQGESRIADYVLKQLKREPAMADRVLILPTDYQQLRTPELPRPVCYPDELRQAFRRLLEQHAERLCQGQIIQIFSTAEPPSLILAIVPITDAGPKGVRRARKLNRSRVGIRKFRLNTTSALLIVPGHRSAATCCGDPIVVLRDLSALFTSLICPDPQYIRSESYRRLAAALVFLVNGDFHVVGSKPVWVLSDSNRP
jgi:hypothetical protein